MSDFFKDSVKHDAKIGAKAGVKAGSKAQIVLGMLVVAVGLLFLADNLGWIDMNVRIHLWPTALIFFGILKLLQTRSTSGAVIGGGLIVVGCLLMLKASGLLDLDWRSLWPLLLIGFGLSVVFKSTTGKSILANTNGPLDKELDDSTVDITAFMGGFKRRVITQDFRGGEITALMGGCELDLRQSAIQSEAVLNVFSMFGGVTIKVPVDWTVVLQGTPILGGFEEKTVPPAMADKRLYVRGYAIMGGLEVRN